MSKHQPVAALRVANEAFLVASMIERCPKTMMLRELVVNAIEAAQASTGGLVEIRARTIDGVRKLSIWNTGRGLSAAELYAICDLASSLNKQNSLDGNFGMGAKVASLPSNRHGLRYRSCKDGVVSEVVMGERDGVYGRLRRGEAEVYDVSQDCRNEGGYDLGIDWTEVVLFGNRPEQDTVADPFCGNPKSPFDWLVRNLTLRFWKLPPGVALRIMPEVLGTAEARTLQCLAERRDSFGRTETVTTASGIALHYFYDPAEGASTRSARGALVTPGAFACLVYKNEIYDVRDGDRWLQEAPIFGFPFGARFISVLVELPDDYPVRPEAYRQFLRFRGGDQRQVFVQELGQLVRAHIPGWLADVVRSFGPQNTDFSEAMESELRDLLIELDVAAQYVPPPPKVTQPPAKAPQPAAAEAMQQPPAKPVPPKKRYERPPQIIGLDTEALVEERGLAGRAAKFYPQSHQLFVNLHYASITSLADHLTAEFSHVEAPEAVREKALAIARRMITSRIARALIFSLTKKANGWTIQQVQTAQSPETLSLIADDWATLHESARLALEQALVV